MKFNKLNDFTKWAEKYNHFQGLGYIKEINNSYPDKIAMIFGFQVGGSLNAFEKKRCEEISLSFNEIIDYKFNGKPNDIGVDNLLYSGLEYDFNNFRPNFYIKDIFEISLEAKVFEILKNEVVEYVVEPFINPRNFYFEIEDGKELKSILFTNEDIVLRRYGGNEKLENFDLFDMKGYFIQKKDRLSINDKGIFINDIYSKHGLLTLHLNLQDDNLKPIWEDLINKLINHIKLVKISSGNVNLNKEDWLKEELPLWS